MDVEVFQCLICLDVAKNAVEVECCGKIFCNTCLDNVDGAACPHCRHNPRKYHVNQSVRRALASATLKCSHEGCEFVGALQDLTKHVKSCAKRQYECPEVDCDFKSTKAVFAAHLVDAHLDELTANAAALFITDQNVDLEAVSIVKNDIGRTARLGENGKYYCGGGRNCVCDADPDPGNYLCGYQNGCNCRSCMKLDLKARNLTKGWYVNDDGSACQMSDVTQLIYCGRRLLDEQSNQARLDAYCGPKQGPQCNACELLQKHVKDGIY